MDLSSWGVGWTLMGLPKVILAAILSHIWPYLPTGGPSCLKNELDTGLTRLKMISHIWWGQLDPFWPVQNGPLGLRRPPKQPFLTTKSGVSFFIRASEDPFFCTPIHWKWLFSGAKKWVFWRPNKKRTPHFVVNYTQKWWMRHLFHMNITIGWVLGNFWKLRILGSFLADFPL